MRRYLLLFVLILIFAATLGRAAASYMQVRVYPVSKTEYLKLQELNLDQVGRTADYIEIVTHAEELARLKALGFRTEVIHDDLVTYYQSRLPDDKDMGGYMTLTEVWAALDQIVADHPEICSDKLNLGFTHEGRPMWAVKISDNPSVNEDEPEVMFTSAIHAREVITPMVILNVMNHLTNNYGTLPEVTSLVDSREMWFVPIVNPDGYYHNQVLEPGGGGMWRKNRRDNGDGTHGVDLNRNYGYQWGYDDDGSSPDPGSDLYRGPSAFSEPETQNMRDFTIANHFVFTIYFHSHGNLIIWPWGYDYLVTPDEALFQALGDTMATFNSYTPKAAHGLYPANGVTDDWGYGEQLLKDKNLAFTFEVGSGFDGFWPDTSRIDALLAENLQPPLILADLADNPQAVLPPEPPVLFVADSTDSAAFEVTWTFDDTLNPALYFELVQLEGYQRITDPASNFANWEPHLFTLSETRSYSAATSFYSGSGNNMTNHATTTSTVSVTSGDTLSVWMWYDIEADWDYAYVETSVDGASFTPLAGNVTTSSDPNGYNRGHGITGSSGGWINGLFDLAAYNGQTIYLRLSYYTDSWVDEEGIYFDEIYPVEGFALATVIGDDLTGRRYTFVDHATGTYWFQLRAEDGDGQKGSWSNIVQTVVTNGDEVCYDTDGDGYGDPDHPENTCPDDNCPLVYNDDQADGDGDGVGDVCDNCMSVANLDQADVDSDNYGDLCDNCPGAANPDQTDTDYDSLGDVCDVCPNDPDNDLDTDSVCGDIDNCPTVYNPDQTSTGGLPEGDACCCLMRGDIDHSGAIDIEDLVGLVDYMFGEGLAALCPEEGDVDGSSSAADIADLVYLVSYMFQFGPEPPPCP